MPGLTNQETMKNITVHGKHVKGSGLANKIMHDEHPELGNNIYEGTVNFEIEKPFTPPLDGDVKEAAKKRNPPRYEKDGNHISPTARLVSINGNLITGYFYRGGWSNILEVVFRKNIAELLQCKTFELGLVYMDESEAEEILNLIQKENPQGDSLWIKLQQKADEILGV